MKNNYIEMNKSEKREVKKYLSKGIGYLSFETKRKSLVLTSNITPDFNELKIEDWGLLVVKGCFIKDVGGMLDHPSRMLMNLCKICL